MADPIRVAEMTQAQLRSTIQSAVFVAMFGVAIVSAAIIVVLRTLV